MTILRRAAVALAATSALVVGAAPAMAHDCTNSSKKQGAGSVADLSITFVVTDQGEPVEVVEEDLSPKVNPNGMPRGAFFTVHFAAVIGDAEPVSLGDYDVFLHSDLPDPARFGGPGDGMCDGVGIDDVGTCLEAAIDDLMAG